jgi:hypothetical protein
MDKFILLSMKRTGSNNLTSSISMSSREKLVWFDAPPPTWETFDLPFPKNIWDYDIKWCLDKLFERYSGCKINCDEPAFYNIVDDLINYPVKKIFLYRENVWEKVISEELAIQSNHWIAPIGAHKYLKNNHKYESIDVESLKNNMDDIWSKMNYLKTFIGDNVIPYRYEDLFSRNDYNQSHRDNFFKLLSELNIKYEENKIDDIISQFMEPYNCYKTDDTYQNIANISELEKLKDYL